MRASGSVLSLGGPAIRRCSVTLLLLAPLCAFAAPPKGFRDIVFGSTIEDARPHLNTDLDCLEPEIKDPVCAFDTMIGDVPADVEMFFPRGKFSGVTITFPAESYAVLRDAFCEKYGKPTEITHTPMQNAFGAIVMDEFITWKFGASFVTIRRYNFEVTRGAAVIGLSSWQRDRDKHRDDAKKKALKDF